MAGSLEHLTVDGHLLAWADAQTIAFAHLVEGDILLAAVVANEPSRLRCHPEQLFDGCAGLATGLQLEDLAEQDQRHDDASRFEVHGDLAAVTAERVGEDAWKERGDEAVDVGDADAEPDQREHVEAHVLHRANRAHVEGPRRPETDRGGERQLDERPCSSGQDAGDRPAREHVDHDDGHERQRECGGEPEASRHVAQFRVVLFLVERHGARLEGHAADRTVTRLVPNNLGVHRAGPLRLRRQHRHALGFQRHPALRTVARADLLDLGVHRAGEHRARRCLVGLVVVQVEVAVRVGGELLSAAS